MLMLCPFDLFTSAWSASSCLRKSSFSLLWQQSYMGSAPMEEASEDNMAVEAACGRHGGGLELVGLGDNMVVERRGSEWDPGATFGS